jgi:hypothetical protein
MAIPPRSPSGSLPLDSEIEQLPTLILDEAEG